MAANRLSFRADLEKGRFSFQVGILAATEGHLRATLMARLGGVGFGKP